MKKLLLAAVALLVASAAFAQNTTLFDGKKTFDFQSIYFNPSTGGLAGTTTNNSASAGIVGEIIETTVAVGSAVSLSTGTAANMGSVSLTAGDWDVRCNADHNFAGTTTVTIMQTGISAVSATLAAQTGGAGVDTDPTAIWRQASAAPGGLVTQSVGPVRVSVAATTPIYCVAQDTFGTSTDAVYGTISARRVR